MKGLGRLLRLLLPHWRMVLLGVFLSVLALAANMGLLALSSWFIASMAIAGSLGATMDYATPSAAVRGLALLRAGGRYAERLANHDTTLRVLSSLRVWFFRRIEPLAPARLAAHRSGDLLSRIRADVDTLDDFYVRGVVPAIAAVLAVAAAAPVLARFDPRLMLIDVAGLSCAGVLLPLVLRRLAERPGRERVARLAALRSSVVEEVQGMAELVALGALDGHAAAVRAVGRELDDRDRRLSTLQGAGEAGLVAMSSLALWAAAWLLVPAVAGGSLPPAHLAMLTVLVLASFEAVLPLPAVVQRAGEMAAAARRLFALIDAEPAVVDAAPSAESSANAEAAARSPALGITVKDLGFRYAPGERRVIDGLSFSVAPGQRLAVVGRTGIGKSTLVNILLRFWDYEAGEIFLSGPWARPLDLRALSGAQARRLFSVMPQAPHLFHATLRENLQLAAPEGKEFEDSIMIEAMQAALLGDFLAALPEGLGTTVGETGRALSMGEIRRLALARAFLKEAPVSLLDEPTEGLDEATADALLAAVDRRLAGRTLIVITHRDRDLTLADEVVRLGPGSRRLFPVAVQQRVEPAGRLLPRLLAGEP